MTTYAMALVTGEDFRQTLLALKVHALDGTVDVCCGLALERSDAAQLSLPPGKARLRRHLGVWSPRALNQTEIRHEGVTNA